MRKHPGYPHTLFFLLLMLGAVELSIPARAAGASPDSLLQMPIIKRTNTMAALHYAAAKTDSTRERKYVEELTHFFDERGTKEDKLVFQVSLLSYDKDDPKKVSIFPSRAQSLLWEAEKSDNTFLIARIHQNMAMFYYNTLKEYGSAFRHYFRMYDLIKGMNEATFPGRNYAIYLLARAYYDFFDYENAIQVGKVLKDVEPGLIQDTHIFNACMLGMSYLRLGRYAEAQQEFEWALDRLPVKPLNHTAWVGILKGDIGLTFFEQKKYEEAIPYLQKGFDLCVQTQLWDNASNFSVKLARINLVQKQSQRAYELARQTLHIAHRIQDPIQPRGLYMAEPYQLMSDCSRALGLYSEAVVYADSAALANEQWHQVRDVAHKHKAEIALEMERHEARQALLEKEKERQILYRNGLLLLTLLGFIIAALLYNRQTLKGRHRQQQLLAEKQLAETELHNALAQLQQFRENARRKNQLITRLADDWQQAPANAAEDPARQEAMDTLHRSVLLTEDDWKTFTSLFEKVHPGFLYRLRVRLPDLSPAETRYLALCKLSYSPHEMAAMLGVGLGAIRQYRLRIRRKFDVADETEMEQLVAAI